MAAASLACGVTTSEYEPALGRLVIIFKETHCKLGRGKYIYNTLCSTFYPPSTNYLSLALLDS